jgi:hypothetical protein
MRISPANPLLAALSNQSPHADKRVKEILPQLEPAWAHIIFVPTVESLIKGDYFVEHEEFISSHILVARTGAPSRSQNAKSKTRQFSTFNGRAVVIKEDFVYTHKG